ncbi:type II toxin-antitoxin system PemK/MazF family toxin [Edaphocola aurantiacus]|uniref:type II toxin-antitoxin system PemK/MazF family toxin n=1 Tax=Edaphocola aurantiacus TaxID=2601682 RepID=UPI001C942BAB|nr:type II toxin-antitoxin system PemK/MazF family toxin [Edaphocola aurantiacus]
MTYQKGDIVEIYFKLPNQGNPKPHPIVIISHEDVYHQDYYYIGVMLTQSTHIDDFSFEITKEMVTNHNGKYSQARCHLITNFEDTHIVPNAHSNKMKQSAVNELIAFINVITFDFPLE